MECYNLLIDKYIINYADVLHLQLNKKKHDYLVIMIQFK